MAKSKSFVFWSLLCLSHTSMVACATTQDKNTKSAPIYFSDCTVVSLQGTDGRNMTREELIAAEDNTLLEALDRNNECHQKALSGAQQALAAAGNGAGSGGGSGGQNDGIQNDANGQQSQQSPQSDQQNEQVVSANSGVGGAKSGVEGQEITVCQISRENLSASTTDEDRVFWQGEVDKNCN